MPVGPGYPIQSVASTTPVCYGGQMKHHGGQKKHPCSLCGKMFTRNDSLRRHIQRCHSTERPYECTLCNKDYAVKVDLDQHMMMSHNMRKVMGDHYEHIAKNT